uniref:Uncharacterized protein n=1 Tax=Knipowitschia caucasica TaxID=637954 RepID=A0AAV2K9R2_KNICA
MAYFYSAYPWGISVDLGVLHKFAQEKSPPVGDRAHWAAPVAAECMGLAPPENTSGRSPRVERWGPTLASRVLHRSTCLPQAMAPHVQDSRCVRNAVMYLCGGGGAWEDVGGCYYAPRGHYRAGRRGKTRHNNATTRFLPPPPAYQKTHSRIRLGC